MAGQLSLDSVENQNRFLNFCDPPKDLASDSKILKIGDLEDTEKEALSNIIKNLFWIPGIAPPPSWQPIQDTKKIVKEKFGFDGDPAPGGGPRTSLFGEWLHQKGNTLEFLRGKSTTGHEPIPTGLYAAQDAGPITVKNPQLIITPGTVLDPAGKTKTGADYLFNGGYDRLPANYIRQLSLENVITGEIRGITNEGNTAFTITIPTNLGPGGAAYDIIGNIDSTFQPNAGSATYAYFKGNPTKNAFIKTHHDRLPENSNEVKRYLLIKELGDTLQVQWLNRVFDVANEAGAPTRALAETAQSNAKEAARQSIKDGFIQDIMTTGGKSLEQATADAEARITEQLAAAGDNEIKSKIEAAGKKAYDAIHPKYHRGNTVIMTNDIILFYRALVNNVAVVLAYDGKTKLYKSKQAGDAFIDAALIETIRRETISHNVSVIKIIEDAITSASGDAWIGGVQWHNKKLKELAVDYLTKLVEKLKLLNNDFDKNFKILDTPAAAKIFSARTHFISPFTWYKTYYRVNKDVTEILKDYGIRFSGANFTSTAFQKQKIIAGIFTNLFSGDELTSQGKYASVKGGKRRQQGGANIQTVKDRAQVAKNTAEALVTPGTGRLTGAGAAAAAAAANTAQLALEESISELLTNTITAILSQAPVGDIVEPADIPIPPLPAAIEEIVGDESRFNEKFGYIWEQITGTRIADLQYHGYFLYCFIRENFPQIFDYAYIVKKASKNLFTEIYAEEGAAASAAADAAAAPAAAAYAAADAAADAAAADAADAAAADAAAVSAAADAAAAVAAAAAESAAVDAAAAAAAAAGAAADAAAAAAAAADEVANAYNELLKIPEDKKGERATRKAEFNFIRSIQLIEDRFAVLRPEIATAFTNLKEIFKTLKALEQSEEASVREIRLETIHLKQAIAEIKESTLDALEQARKQAQVKQAAYASAILFQRFNHVPSNISLKDKYTNLIYNFSPRFTYEVVELPNDPYRLAPTQNFTQTREALSLAKYFLDAFPQFQTQELADFFAKLERFGPENNKLIYPPPSYDITARADVARLGMEGGQYGGGKDTIDPVLESAIDIYEIYYALRIQAAYADTEVTDDDLDAELAKVDVGPVPGAATPVAPVGHKGTNVKMNNGTRKSLHNGTAAVENFVRHASASELRREAEKLSREAGGAAYTEEEGQDLINLVNYFLMVANQKNMQTRKARYTKSGLLRSGSKRNKPNVSVYSNKIFNGKMNENARVNNENVIQQIKRNALDPSRIEAAATAPAAGGKSRYRKTQKHKNTRKQKRKTRRNKK